MFGSPLLSKASRNWKLVVMAGGAGFAVGLAAFAICGVQWLIDVLTETSALLAAIVVALPFGLGAAALAGLFVNGRRRAQARLLRSALNNMTQGLCMFDSTSRLILCNGRYIEMYQLRPEHARAGVPLRELLDYRIAAGTFSGDPDHYVAECLRQVVE